MRLLSWLKSAPVIPEMENENEVQGQYKYWRWRIFYSMYIGYIFYYFTRKSLTFAMPMLMADLDFKISDIGILSSLFSITYGASKFASGMLSDRSNPRFFMGIGLILTGIFNICFGMSSSLAFFAVFWVFNGWFQGWGWPPCARLLTHWYAQKERGTWWGITTTSHSVGGALIPLVVAYCANEWGWRSAMYIPGVICMFVGFALMNRLRDTPQSLGLPPIEKFKGEEPKEGKASVESLSMKEMLFKYVLTNKYIWILAISYFFVYVIRQAVNDFTVLFLVQQKGYSVMAASGSIVWFEAGGILGALIAGWGSDKLFNGQRAPVNLLFCLGTVAAIAAFYMTPPGFIAVDYALIFLVGILVFGPQMLIGMAAVELSHKKAAGTANGFVSWIAYLGAATAGYPISKVIELHGWYGFFVALGICGLAAVCLLAPLWTVRSGPKAVAES